MSDVKQIFISYKTEQRSLAFIVRDKLKDWGYETWLDVDQLQPGRYWANDIDQALKTCDACVAVMTPQSINSRYVTNEWDMAIMKDKLLLPLMFEATEPHYKYIDIQYIDFTSNDKESSFSQLKARLDGHRPESDTNRLQDPYRDYLRQLYDRINKYLSAKLITSLRDDEDHPEPIRLSVERTEGTVDFLFEKREEIDPLFAIGGIAAVSTPEFDDIDTAVNYYDGRVLLLGEPGSGKTISLLHYARDSVVKRRQDMSALLPILGIIPTWDANKHASIAAWLASSYGAPKGAIEVIESGKSLLLLDGLDELGKERPVDSDNLEGEKYDPRLLFIQSLPTEGKILLTCRSSDYREIQVNVPLRGAITLKPLDKGQMKAYLRGQPKILEIITGDRGLQEWLDTPLLLSFFAFAFEKMNEEERKNILTIRQLSELNATIYDTYIRGNYDRLVAKPNANISFSVDDIYEVMGWVSVRNIVSLLATGGQLVNHSFVSKLDFSRILDFTQLMVAMNVLVATDDGYQYIHIALRDHFASNCAYRMVVDEDLENRLNAIYVFETTRDTRSIPHLIKCLNDNYARVRGTAAQVLGDIGDWRSLPGLVELTHDGDKVIRKIALDAIAKTRDEQSVGILIKTLAHNNPAVGQAAFNALTNIGYFAGDRFISALKNDNALIRGKVAQILGIIDYKPAIDALKTLHTDTAEVGFGLRVCDLANEAIAKLD